MNKKQTFSDLVWQFFCSVKLTIYTLVLLAATSIIGTVILQNGSEPEYIRLYGETVYNLIRIFDFDDMYQAWWFLGLIIVLCINIIVCSIERLTHTWKIIFPKDIPIKPERFLTKKPLDVFTVPTEAASFEPRVRKMLRQHIGTVNKKNTQTGPGFYAESGRWTRVGVYIVHSSILLLLIGALIGAVFGFKANLRINEGQTADTVFLSKKRTPVKLDFQIRCNEFEVKFYDTGAPEEFRSNLTIIENNNEILTRDIRVNHPLRYNGINIFQASYGPAAPDSVQLEVLDAKNNKSFVIPVKIGQDVKLPEDLGRLKLEGFLPHFSFRGHNLGEAFIATITPVTGDVFQIGLPVKFPSFDKMRKGDFAVIIKTFKQKFYTGLQVTKDPGVWYVYAGFVLMIIGCWITFFMSFKTCFILLEPTENKRLKVSVFGTSNRNRHGYKLKINKMTTQLKDS